MNEIAMPITPTRDAIDRLAAELKKLPQVEVLTSHWLNDGIYIRSMFLKKGTALVGQVHKKEHFFVILYGDLEVMTEHGMGRFIGATILIGKPGIKRAGFAHADTMLMTIHRTDKTDLREIEEEIAEPDPTSMFLTGNVLKSSVIGEPE